MPRERSRYRDRRSSSYSSDSSYERKKTKSKRKKRSRSKERSESSIRRKRPSSLSRHQRRSYSRSLSRDRYESKSKKRSPSRSRSKRSRRSVSRERSQSHSRSSSRARSQRNKTHKKSRKRSRSSSNRSSSFDIEPAQVRTLKLDDTNTKIEKAIKAAEAAGLTMTKIPTYEYKEVEIKEDMPTIHDRNLLEELNSDSFVQAAFTSTRSKKQNILIDLDSQTVKVPEADVKVQSEDTVIDINALPSDAEAQEMWIKKLYQFRKKMLRGDI